MKSGAETWRQQATQIASILLAAGLILFPAYALPQTSLRGLSPISGPLYCADGQRLRRVLRLLIL
jgi:hypothetical protein